MADFLHMKMEITQRGRIAQMLCRHLWVGGYAETAYNPKEIFWYPQANTNWHHFLCRKCGKSIWVRPATEMQIDEWREVDDG